MKKEIEQVLSNKDILSIPPNKGIYHLCLATSYLTNEQYNLDLLRDLKPICRRPPGQSSNEAAVEIIADKKQRGILPPDRNQPHKDQNQGEKQEKGVGIVKHKTSWGK